MITNFETNKVFIPNGLIREDVAGCLIYFIHRHEIDWGILPGSSSPLHIWARDYMPVQVSKDKYVRFCYTPDYLQDCPEYKPDTSAILSELGIQVIDSDIVVDGGNVISCGDKVVMTDKIIRENPHYQRNKLIDTLNQLLEAEVILIPEDKYDGYGHADGMVRYMGNNCVLLNNYYDLDKKLRKRLLATLSPHFDITELHYGAYTDNSWAYINFLHVGQHIFVPKPEDRLAEIAIRQVAEAYPECECHPIWECDDIIREGGALNCCTWNILTELTEKENNRELPNTK